MNLKVLILLMSLPNLTITSTGRFKRRVGQWGPKKISCFGNPKYMKNTFCTMKAINRKWLAISIGSTFLDAQSDMKLQIQHWQKMYSNRYMPGLFNVKGEICQFVESFGDNKPNVLKSVLSQLEPGFEERYKSIIHPCPYLGPISLNNVSVPRFYNLPIMTLIPTADYKIDYTIQHSSGEEMFKVTLYSSDK